jgi:hypothetical protein
MRRVLDEIEPGEERGVVEVVATWLIPPPTESTSRPPAIIGAGTNPFSSVRSPSASFMEKRAPAGMIVPSSS